MNSLRVFLVMTVVLSVRLVQGQPITIPVVVHVVYHEEEENISDEQIHSQIEVLNEDFRAENLDLALVLSGFAGLVADMEINFELATVDPTGSPTSGIIRVQTPWPQVGSAFVNQPGPDLGKRRICYDEHGGSSAWCTDCYLNIWVGALDGAAGIGIFPFQVGEEVPRAEDGVYISPHRFGRTGSVEAPYDLGRTLTHEVGHYLNLYHLWGPEILPDPCSPSVCCEDDLYDDEVSDTPRQNSTYQDECPIGPQFTCGSFDNYQNFMNYTDDACLLMFTHGQKERVWEALATYRSGFLGEHCPQLCVTATVEVLAPEAVLVSFYRDGPDLILETIQTDVQWALIDNLGRVLRTYETGAAGWHRWTIGELPAGLYYLHARWGRSITTKKVIIVRRG